MYLFKKFELMGESNMAVLKVKFDNILCFNNFEADFSYPKKLVKTTLESEYLKDYPNIRYRKLNIIVGSNASGKTSLGKAIWKVFSFLLNKEAKILTDIISNPNKDAFILMDCVYPEGLFFRVEIKLPSKGEILVRYREMMIDKNDSYETIISRLNELEQPFNNYIKELEHVTVSGWNFLFPSIESGFDVISCHYAKSERKEFANVLERVLKTFDETVNSVVPSKEIDNSYIVSFKNGLKPISITNGDKLSEIRLLSSGSKYAVNIAGIIYSIKKHRNGFYFVDEQFSYVNHDLEIACLATMVNLLDDGEQLFFTTHDTEILSLPFPNHSYNFLKKIIDENGQATIQMINAASLEKRNNVNIKNLYDNDFFEVAPDASLILELGDK